MPKRFIFGGLIAILALGLFFGYYNHLNKDTNPNKVETLVSDISKIISLPDETPVVALVNDPQKLVQTQLSSFFKTAQKGDIFLLFEKSKKAILYRPSTKKVIEAASINTTNPAQVAGTSSAKLQTQPPNSSSSASESIKFAIFNSTTTKNLAKNYEPELKKAITSATVIERGNSKNNYTESLFIDLTGAKNDLAKQLAQKLGLKYSSMPQDEVKPSQSEFLIILGSDKAK